MSACPQNAISGLHWSDVGCASLDGSLPARAVELDGLFHRQAAAQGAIDHRFPSMISAAELAPVAWLRSFPHLATFVTSAGRKHEAQAKLAEACGNAASVPVSADMLEPRCRADVDAFVQRLGIGAGWKSATDSFFDPTNDPKALAQRVEPAKLELCRSRWPQLDPQ